MVSRAAAGPRCSSSSGCAGGPRRARWRQSTCGKMASLAHRFDSFAFFFLVEHHAPERDGVTGAEGRLDFVRIAPVRPEEDEPVEDGLDVGHLIRPALREDAQQATVLLFKKKKNPKNIGIIPFWPFPHEGTGSGFGQNRMESKLRVWTGSKTVDCYQFQSHQARKSTTKESVRDEGPIYHL